MAALSDLLYFSAVGILETVCLLWSTSHGWLYSNENIKNGHNGQAVRLDDMCILWPNVRSCCTTWILWNSEINLKERSSHDSYPTEMMPISCASLNSTHLLVPSDRNLVWLLIILLRIKQLLSYPPRYCLAEVLLHFSRQVPFPLNGGESCIVQDQKKNTSL